MAETLACGVLSDNAIECFPLTIKGQQMPISYDARENYKSYLLWENLRKRTKYEERKKLVRKKPVRSFVQPHGELLNPSEFNFERKN